MKLLIKSSSVTFGMEPSAVEYGEAIQDAQKNYLKMLDDNGFEVVHKESVSPWASEVEYFCDSWGDDKLSVDVIVRENSMVPDRISKLWVNGVPISVYDSYDPTAPYRTLRECNMYDLVQDILPNIDSEKIIWK